jgi:hypothetical protein
VTCPDPSCARRRYRRAAALIAAAAAGGGVWAQSAAEVGKPVGIPWGRVMIAPSLIAGYSYNSNLFLNAENLSPNPDQVLTVQPGVQLRAGVQHRH